MRLKEHLITADVPGLGRLWLRGLEALGENFEEITRTGVVDL